MTTKISYILLCSGLLLLLGGCSEKISSFPSSVVESSAEQVDIREQENSNIIKYCSDINVCFQYGFSDVSVYGSSIPLPSLSGFIFSGEQYREPSLDDAPGNKKFNIIFDNDDYIEDDITYRDRYSISGQIMQGVESVEVIRDGDKSSYFLQQFIPRSGIFTYNISTALGNIQPGINKYLVRGYQSPNIVYERVFELKYITGGQDIILTPAKTLQKGSVIPNNKRYSTQCSVNYGRYVYDIDYRVGRNIYYLGFSPYTFATQIFKHDTGIEIIYTTEQGLTQSVITIRNKEGRLSNSVIYVAGCPTAEGSILADFLTGGYITIDKGSNMTWPLIYNPKTNTIIDMMKDLVLPTFTGQPQRDYYVGEYTISGNNLNILASRYYYTQYHQELLFDINTKKLIKKGEIL